MLAGFGVHSAHFRTNLVAIGLYIENAWAILLLPIPLLPNLD